MSTSELLFETQWLQLFRRGKWDYVRRPHAEVCVGILPITDDQQVVLVEQFRIPLQQRVIEIPAGMVGDEPEFADESIEQTAHRELLEETGYDAKSMRALIHSPTSGGMTSEFFHLFLATDLVRVHQGGGINHEAIVVHHIPLAGLREWLAEQGRAGKAIDFRIHAGLWLANLPG